MGSNPAYPTTASTNDASLSEAMTARTVMANDTRKTFLQQYGMDLSARTDAEVIDSLKYNVFPNMMIYEGAEIRALTLFRPLGHDPAKATIDRLTFLPVPKGEPRPHPAEVVTVRENESYAVAPDLTEFMAEVLDQDTSIMRLQQEGMHYLGLHRPERRQRRPLGAGIRAPSHSQRCGASVVESATPS